MEIRCPACSKVNSTEAQCSRCGSDLAVLVNILHAAAAELTLSKKSLASGKVSAALHHARRSWRLKKSSDAAQLAFLSSLAGASPDEAAQWYARAVQEGSSSITEKKTE
ncbi:MAG: hypothetical protein WCQ99_03075 [Pseudomonadota bacterium]